MIRFLATIIVGASISAVHGEEQINPPLAAPSAASGGGTAAMSVVAMVTNDRAMNGFDEDPQESKAMVDQLIQLYTQKPTPAAAWREIAGPTDRVGIKVSTGGGRYFATRRGVVAGVVAGLRGAGVKNIFVWDKSAASLRAAGFLPEIVGCEVRSIEPPKGWDRTAPFTAPVLGKLIWGDLLFSEKVADKTADPLSSKSHLSTILSRNVTKFINIPALSDDPDCGVAGAIHSAVISNLDNWRRFTSFGEGGAAAAAELYADPRIGGKCALHILDALAVTYAGGPGPNPEHSFSHATLYASRDPISLDAIGLRLMEKWRSEASLGPIGAKGAWIAGAAAIGNADERKILLRKSP